MYIGICSKWQIYTYNNIKDILLLLDKGKKGVNILPPSLKSAATLFVIAVPALNSSRISLNLLFYTLLLEYYSLITIFH